MSIYLIINTLNLDEITLLISEKQRTENLIKYKRKVFKNLFTERFN